MDLLPNADVYRYVPTKQVWHRKFSDQELIDAAQSNGPKPKVSTLAKRFNCTNGTIRSHAKRLGLQLQGYAGVVWTVEEDEWVRNCAEGKCTIADVTRATAHASSSVQKRAEILGLRLPIKKAGFSGPSFGRRPQPSYDYVLTVGKVDRLLERLIAEFGSPRNEVYPGSQVRA